MSNEKYSELLKNKDVNTWFREVKRGSEITANTYKRRLGSFCDFVEKDPLQLLKMKDKTLVDMIFDYVSDMEDKGKAGSYIKSTLKAVRSWLTFNGIKLQRSIKVRDADDTPTLKNERIPDHEELKRIFDGGDIRSRVACSLMAFSGVRPGVIGNYRGTEGLRLSDITDLRIEGKEISFDSIPARIDVRKELSKTGKKYFTFIGDEGCKYLELYFRERIREGERLVPDSALLTPSKPAIRKAKPFVTTINVGDTIREAIRKAGFRLRPYVLRAYFDTRLMLAQDERLLIRDYRTFFMGHKGDIEALYTLNKGVLSPDTVEKMRDAYKRSLKHLETERKEDKKELVKQLRENTLNTLQLFDRVNLSEKEKDELLDLEEEEYYRRLEKMIGGKKTGSANNRENFKTISESDLHDYLTNGWTEVHTYKDGKIEVKFPE